MKSAKEKHKRSQTLLAINDLLFLILIQESYNRSKKILIIMTIKLIAIIIWKCEGKNVIPKRLTFLFFPSIRALIIWNKKISFIITQQEFHTLLFNT